MTDRRHTRRIRVGGLEIGGGASVSVQTMANADAHDAVAVKAQVDRCAAVGADLVRLAVPDADAVDVFAEVRRSSRVPLVADIHFDYRLALAALKAGADALRLNPGNIGAPENVRKVAHEAKAIGVPIRVGVNAGSLDREVLARHGGATAAALVESALAHVGLLEREGFDSIAISVKASDVPRTLEAYRMLAERTDYPLHLGVTEAGTLLPGTVRSSVAMGILLAEGIGDTIRVSLTDAPEREVRTGIEILRALGLRARGPSVTSCPTCGRTRVDLQRVAGEVELALEELSRRYPRAEFPKVAVMGCAVNGPGEARDADVALCGGTGEFLLYVGGTFRCKVSEKDAVAVLVSAVKDML